jgi:type I restriction enzyme, S subunit
MRKYDSYKDSGIEWIGEIPNHWESSRYRYFYFSNMGVTLLKEDVKEDGIYPVYSATETDVLFGYVDEAAVILNEGDIVIPARGNSIGHIKVVTSPSTSTQTTIYSKKISQNIETNFVKYFLQGLREHLFQFDRTAIPQITVNQVKNNPLVIPTPEEQSAIAIYLDRKTAEIDELIADKKRLLEFYEEEKTAIINQAVTKGINPDAPMKDSGIEWLGEIPEHWETVSFNHYVFLRHGYQFRNYDFTSTGLKVIKITQLKANGELEVNDVSFIDENRLDEFKDILIEEGDILMALTGGTIGKIIRAPKINEPLLQNYRVGNFFPKNDSITKDFLFWVLSSDLILKQIFFDQRETGQPNIGKEDFGRMFLVLPSTIKEQEEIVLFINNEIERINSKKSKTEKLIELLTEYRTALISEVVTGKIKVIE